MKSSYFSNYLKIYFWQFLAVVLNLLSMFIVVPRLSQVPSIYGIYSLCIAASIFLIYADFGFIGAGYKFASESFARKDIVDEIKIIGFVGFILFVSIVFYSIIMLIFSFNPQILIKKNLDPAELKIASYLLFILAFSSPIILLQRLMQVIYGIRLEDFVFQKIMVIFNLAKILSVVYFFSSKRYNIVGYFCFCQVMTLFAGIIAIFLAKKLYKYDFNLLFRSFKFSKKVFLRTRNIAFSSLFITVASILYYELDPFIIVKLLGAENLALYAIGLTLLSYFRAIFGMIYGPFQARFNHFIGLKDEIGLRRIYKKTIILVLPVVIFPILTVVALMKPFVYSWVGDKYRSSVLISQFLIGSYIYSFLAYPASILMMAKEKIRLLYIVNMILPIVYWCGILLTVSSLGIIAFSLFKFISFSILALVYFIFSKRFLELTTVGLLKDIFLPAILPGIFLFFSLTSIIRFLPYEKSNLSFLISISTIGVISCSSIFLYSFFSKEHRKLLNNLYERFIKRNEVLLKI